MGHVFCPSKRSDWRANSALTPTPILINNETIRVYVGFRDQQGISRIGYIDLSAENPTIIKYVSKQPVLSIGRAGCFDDNGVILGDIVRLNDGCLRMYYVGFQLVRKVKFLAFTGVAHSHDNGEHFSRYSEVPILDRVDGSTTIRAVHTALYENNMWKIWYAAGDDWLLINGQPYPKYNIWYVESADGLSFTKPSTLCIDVEGQEYRIGRPSVYYEKNRYIMLYTKGNTNGIDYFPGVATSEDGIHWIREDHKFGLNLSIDGFDSIHLCYPRLIHVKDKVYCVYNGNNMGIEGFGVAELIRW